MVAASPGVAGEVVGQPRSSVVASPTLRTARSNASSVMARGRGDAAYFADVLASGGLDLCRRSFGLKAP